MQLIEDSQCLSQQPQPTINQVQEYNVKAVYLYSFGRYVTWPENANAAIGNKFVIGIIGNAPFGSALDKIAKTKKINNLPIRIQRWDSIEEYKLCHILFISKKIPPDKQQAIVSQLTKESVLIVGENDGFATQGGTVNFFIDGKNVRFEINVNAVNRQSLTIDGKLLKIATTIQGK